MVMASTFQIIHWTALRHGVNRDDIIGPRRVQRIVDARWDVIRQLHFLGWSSGMIARVVNRDPSTVRHAIRKVTND